VKRKAISALLAGSIAMSAVVIPSIATAQTSQELMQQIQALQAQLKAIQDQVNKQAQATQQATQTAQQAQQTAKQANTSVAAVQKEADATKASVTTMFEKIKIPEQVNSYKPGTVNMYTGESNPNVAGNSNFMAREKDDSLSFTMPAGGGITLYGNLDVSADYVSNGLSGGSTVPANSNGTAGTHPYGNNGYLGALSTNNTYLGLRGYQPISDWHDTQFLWQLQGNVALTTVSGTSMSNSQQSNSVNGGLTTGTTYVGLGSKDYGAVKVGKTYAPYQLSTQIFNPFQGMLGNYNVIMANTGGDNRVEFGSMMEHSIWYESPSWNNMSFAALFSPGQNRATDSSGIPQSSSNCNGGNIPGSGGTGPQQSAWSTNSCDDGGFSNAFSASLVYDDKKEWYATAAYELHQRVNRGSDIAGSWAYAGNGTGSYLGDPKGQQYAQADIGNESAVKTGLMYHFESTGTRLGGIYEWMYRNIPSYLSYQNERQRSGYWLVLMQDLPGSNQINLGWGHANAAVGDAAGQHNYNPAIPYSASTANMYTIAGIHQVDRNLSFYANYAMTVNNGNAHYDLGAGGHGITTDCHDSGLASGPGAQANGGITGGGQCWGGTKLQGFSVGMRYRF
jgi:hypothetical protein